MAVAAALRVEELSFSYSTGEKALNAVSFSIAPGERAALLGANGAGKSTLLWCLVGILDAAGTVAVDGVVLSKRTEAEVRRKIALAFAEPDDQLFMPTVERDLSFGPRAAGDSMELAADRARASAKRVGLSEALLRRAPHELSSGERRRAALAAVLTSNPKLLALDEPTNSLDAPGCYALARTLRGLDCAMLVATHDLEFVRQLCTRALVLVGGSLVADEALGALMADETRLREYGLAAPEELAR